eukprot:TRINITY_DN416_c2_g1_i1.p4 TRINITY_DN416_c2_g1~~TRINITY_DN416_c2_g1_i1.p4  ORF type:complete len:102 (+),score=19.84 TRINITY_DN416_c2_g1_i1:318-623(+)
MAVQLVRLAPANATEAQMKSLRQAITQEPFTSVIWPPTTKDCCCSTITAFSSQPLSSSFTNIDKATAISLPFDEHCFFNIDFPTGKQPPKCGEAEEAECCF